MEPLTLLLGKNPYVESAGDTRVTRLMMDVIAESRPVRGLALGEPSAQPTPHPVATISKPPVRLRRLAVRAAVSRRSLIHTRFSPQSLVLELRRRADRVLLAEHTYMAEAALAAGSHESLLINSHVLESSVMGGRSAGVRGVPLRIESRRTWRDEVRCARAADAVACLGQTDAERLEAAVPGRVSRIDLLLPPAENPRFDLGGPAVFLGDRSWPPNQVGARALVEIWPKIRKLAPGARLLVVGRPPPDDDLDAPPGVEIAGFVESVDDVLRSARVLLAPISIGGGVRVKLLEAASSGLPVVATKAAAGSISEYLPLGPAASIDRFAEAAARLLLDDAAARSASDQLFETTRQLWEEGFVHSQVDSWINRAVPG